MKRIYTALFPSLVIAFSLSACGYSLLQTAETMPKGQTDVTLGISYLNNELISERDGTALIGNFPQEITVRHGLNEQVEVGASLLFGSGLLLNGKYNFMPHQNPLALSVRGGLGVAGNPFSSDLGVIHLPITVAASYRLKSFITPYMALGYDAWWVFREAPPEQERPEDSSLAKRTLFGDGNLTLTAGIEVGEREGTAWLVEYRLFEPIVDDPGDHHEFVRSHIFAVGVRF